MLSVTLDSNIYISALNYAGPPLRIVNMARDGLIRLDLSNAILEEVGGVLRDKFHWREEDVELAQREIASFSNHVSPQKTLTISDRRCRRQPNRRVRCNGKVGLPHYW